MKFFKENSYDIVKLFINQIGITIFSFMLYTAVAMIEDESLFLKIFDGFNKGSNLLG